MVDVGTEAWLISFLTAPHNHRPCPYNRLARQRPAHQASALSGEGAARPLSLS